MFDKHKKDMVEQHEKEEAGEDEELTGKVVGAIGIGIDKTIGIRVCLLRQDGIEGAVSTDEHQVIFFFFFSLPFLTLTFVIFQFFFLSVLFSYLADQ